MPGTTVEIIEKNLLYPRALEDRTAHELYDYTRYLRNQREHLASNLVDMRKDPSSHDLDTIDDISEEIAHIDVTLDNIDHRLDRMFLVPEFSTHDSVTLLTGKYGIGKTNLAIQIASQVACPTRQHFVRWNDQEEGTKDPVSVMYLSYQNKIEELYHVRENMLKDDFKWIKTSNTNYLDFWSMRGEDDKLFWARGGLTNFGRRTLDACEQYDQKLLVIDSLSAAYQGLGAGYEGSDTSDIFSFVYTLKEWCQKANRSILIVDHLLDSQESIKKGDPGTTAWAAAISNVWCLKSVLYKDEGTDPRKNYSDKTYLYYLMEHVKSDHFPLQETMILGRGRHGTWQQGDTWYDSVQLYGLGPYELTEQEVASINEKGGFCQVSRDANTERKNKSHDAFAA